jgi:hypothetical protein
MTNEIPLQTYQDGNYQKTGNNNAGKNMEILDPLTLLIGM